MTILEELSSSIGDRTQAANRVVAEKVRADPALLSDIADGLSSANVKLVGDCAEIFTMTAEVQPGTVAAYVPRLIPLLGSKNTRVRWESTHTLALVARHAPEALAPILPSLTSAIGRDTSVIVRDYSILALGEYAATGTTAARAVFPHLVDALKVWEGDHAALALEGLAKAAITDQSLVHPVIEIARQYQDHQKAKVKQVARATLRKLGQKP